MAIKVTHKGYSGGRGDDPHGVTNLNDYRESKNKDGLDRAIAEHPSNRKK